MKRNFSKLVGSLIAASAVACGLGSPNADGTYTHESCQPDNPTPVTLEAGEEYGKWISKTLPDTFCGNGTPYRFFVKYEEEATDLTVTFQGGGACWDYQSCNDPVGQLGALNMKLGPAGLDHKYMTRLSPANTAELSAHLVPEEYGMDSARGPEDDGAIPWSRIYNHVGEIDQSVPTNRYNHVFFPYCTGDAFLGREDNANHTTYAEDAPGTGEMPVWHSGRGNIERASTWLAQKFGQGSTTGQLAVFGSSAGGLGAQVNYALIRDNVDPVCSMLVNDSAPIFDQQSSQQLMQHKVNETWNLAALRAEVDAHLDGMADFAGVPQAEIAEQDLASSWSFLATKLAQSYPQDRFLFTTFKNDLIFAAFSYWPALGHAGETAMDFSQEWQDDLVRYVADLSEFDNTGYYMPYHRDDLCSHTLATAPENAQSSSSYLKQAVVGGAHAYLRTEVRHPDYVIEMDDDTLEPGSYSMTTPEEFANWVPPANDVTERVFIDNPDGTTSYKRAIHFGDVIRQTLNQDLEIPRMQSSLSRWFSNSDYARACVLNYKSHL